MKNKKTRIAIIVALAVVITGVGGYFGYGYYCKVNQTKLLNAKVEEFEKFSFDKEKDQKIKIYHNLKEDKGSFPRIEEDYNKTLDKMYKDFSDYYNSDYKNIQKSYDKNNLSVEVLTDSLNKLTTLSETIKKDNVLKKNDSFINEINKEIEDLNKKAYDVVVASFEKDYKELLLTDEEISSQSRSTLESYVSALQSDIEIINNSQLLSDEQKEQFSNEVNPYIEKYNVRIEELKNQEAEAARKAQEQKKQQAAQNSQAQPSNNTYQGHVVPLPEIWRHINAGHQIYIGERGDWYCWTDDMCWAKGYNF